VFRWKSAENIVEHYGEGIMIPRRVWSFLDFLLYFTCARLLELALGVHASNSDAKEWQVHADPRIFENALIPRDSPKRGVRRADRTALMIQCDGASTGGQAHSVPM
jgi:hypothetical protein